MSDTEARHIELRLNAQAVVNPLLKAFQNAVEVVSVCLEAIEKAPLDQPIVAKGSIDLVIQDPNPRPVEEKRAEYSNWLLARGFQEYARGVRASLEEAHFYNAVVRRATNAGLIEQITWEKLQIELAKDRKRATDANFPVLMAEVNKGLTEPLHFEKEFLSLQKVRNCLEHRDGVVAQKDVDPATSGLILTFPRMEMFGEQEGQEVAVKVGDYLEKETRIGIRFATYTREFQLGSRVSITGREFADIGWGCWAFATELAKKLPMLPG